MNSLFMLFPILFPIISAVILAIKRPQSRKVRNTFVLITTIINSIAVMFIIIYKPTEAITIFEITDDIALVLKLDGLGMVFATLIALLWPLASLYSFEYMEHETNLNMFYCFYVMTYGVTIGIALSGNSLTMYLFYEFLTLVTTPLVLHSQKREAVKAARKYLYYSISGAAVGFIAVIFVLVYGNNALFTFGGIMNVDGGTFNVTIMQVVYVLAFVGFGVKVAMFPLHGWLPSASVAPTPVTALLHAVAVVKSGAFVIMRMTYYVFDINILKGTWAQYFVTIMAVVTVLYASTMAVREQHFKRRLAYSTISNLSYIMIGVCFMSPLGFLGALTHMVFHAVMKICSFFCAGAVMEYAKVNYVNQLKGLGKKMPFTFGCFTIAALSLMGMPPLVGFMSKYRLISAATADPNVLSYISIFALFCSSVLVAIYLVFIPIKAFFCEASEDISHAKDPGIRMKLPIGIFATFIVVVGVYSEPLIDFLTQVANGII